MTIKPVSKKLKEALFVVDEGKKTILPANTIFGINGYHFADRLLEDVIFRAQLSEDRKTLTVLGVDSPAYFEQLNTSKWMKEALNYFINEVDYVYSDSDSNHTDWILLKETALKENYPELIEKKLKKPSLITAKTKKK